MFNTQNLKYDDQHQVLHLYPERVYQKSTQPCNLQFDVTEFGLGRFRVRVKTRK